MLKFGISLFFTDYSMHPSDLARELEQRGFESVWSGEHSHMPEVMKSPFLGEGGVKKHYYDVMDPFVTLTAAAMATTTLKIGTGVCLVPQRDPIQTAKLVASIDQISGGRFLFGVGDGWNQSEIENHGVDFKTRHKRARESIQAMKQIWTQSKAEYHGDLVNFDPMMAWPKPLQKPNPPILVGGSFPYADYCLVSAARRGADPAIRRAGCGPSGVHRAVGGPRCRVAGAGRNRCDHGRRQRVMVCGIMLPHRKTP